MAAIHTTPALDIGQPKLLNDFQGRRYSGFTTIAGAFGLGSTFDVSPDGSRILAIKEPEPATTVDLVLNWFEELKRLAPAK